MFVESAVNPVVPFEELNENVPLDPLVTVGSEVVDDVNPSLLHPLPPKKEHKISPNRRITKSNNNFSFVVIV